MELENLLPTRLKSSMKMKALSSKLRFHTHIRQMGLQNAPSGPSWQSGVVCYITPSWTSVSGLKQRWRQSTWRINRLPSPKIPNMTSFEIVCGSKPSVKHMRVFGCHAYILTLREKRLNWDPKARIVIFYGVWRSLQGISSVRYRGRTNSKNTRDVNFDEATFGFSMEKSSEIIKDAIMDLDLLDINEGDVRHVNYKQTCKRKIRPNKQCCSYGSSPSWFKRSKCAGQHVWSSSEEQIKRPKHTKI